MNSLISVFLGKNVEVVLKDSTAIQGKLLAVDSSQHGILGSLIIKVRNPKNGIAIVRGNFMLYIRKLGL